jgi:hypothetical protein
MQNDKAKLVMMINKWERSGNGAGMPRAEEDPNFGRVSFVSGTMDRNQGTYFDGDDRSNFIGGKSERLLYLWDIADRYEILTSFKEMLSQLVAADALSVPSTTSMRKRKGNIGPASEEGGVDEASKFRAELVGHLQVANKNGAIAAISSLRQSIVQVTATKQSALKDWQYARTELRKLSRERYVSIL